MTIEIFDNLVSIEDRTHIYNCCKSSSFVLGWPDQDHTEFNSHSNWSGELVQKSKISNYLELAFTKSEQWDTNTLTFDKCIINLIRNQDVHYIHTHPNQVVFLYYANLDWQDGFYGETIFYNETNTDHIKFTSPYIPGRIIIFDGKIPHAIRPQSITGPKYRFSVSIFLNKN